VANEQYPIKNRWSGEVMFTAEITCSPDALPSVKLGLAVKAALKARADLAGANLAGADLADANLAGADLAGAYLARANLAGAYLARANLARANLAGADLAGAYLARANLAGAYLAGAYLAGADLAGANLAGANLADANLAGADLAGAYLARAYLAGADLAGANLAGANLADAKGFIPERTTHLASLKFMPVVHAFKVVNERGEGHINGGLKYKIGKRVSVKNADTDPNEMCSAGIHVADLPWCLKEWREGYRILLIEHTNADIACIPLGTDGKYRLHGCTPVKDITDKLRECGALPALQVEKAAA
jgi:hypothetical protein